MYQCAFVAEKPWKYAQSDMFSFYAESGHRSRKTHSKSRSGCKHCRRRRIKCDEQKPSCRSCVRLKRHCDYGTLSASPNALAVSLFSLAERQILSALEIDAGSDGQLAGFTKYINLHALESFDHFIRVDEGWLKSRETQRVMQHNAVSTSMWHSYLLHAMLAVSAAHMATRKPNSRSYWMSSATHWQHSLAQYSAAMHAPFEGQDIDALFFATLLHSMLSIFYSAMSMDDLGWVTSMLGNHLLLRIPNSRERLMQGIWKPVIAEHALWLQNVSSNNEDKASCAAFGVLSAYFDSHPPTSIYHERVKTLRVLERHTKTAQDIGGVASFITVAPPEYIEKVRARDCEALLLLYYFCTLYGRINQWWIAPSAAAGVKSIASYLNTHADPALREVLRKMIEASS